MRRLALAALLFLATAILSGSAAFAQPAELTHVFPPARSQAEPRDPFERGGPTGGGAADDSGAVAAGPGGVAAGGTLPRTGGSRTAPLMAVAASFMTAGGTVLWVARYRPRHVR